MAKTKPVPCVWIVCSCNSFDPCSKCGGALGKYEPIEVTKEKPLQVQDETKRCVDVIMSDSRVPGKFQVLLRDAILAEEN